MSYCKTCEDCIPGFMCHSEINRINGAYEESRVYKTYGDCTFGKMSYCKTCGDCTLG